MTIIDTLFNRFGFISQRQFEDKLSEAVKSELDRKLPRWLGETADAQKWDMPNPSIYANQADLYRLSPILGTAVSILGNDLGTAKPNVKRMVGEEVRDIPNHEFELLLRNPNPADSGLELMQYTGSNYLLNGNAIWWQNKAGENEKPLELWPIPFSQVAPIPDKNLYIDHYDYFPGNGKASMRLETWEIVHFRTYNPANRFVGLSPLESLFMTLQGDLAMRKTNTVNYASYGGAPQSILSFKEYVNEPAWGDIKKEVRDAAKRNEMMMLRGVGDGVTWMQRALSNKDMDFVSGLKQNMTDVFNRMCPGLLSMLSESATEANALAARATYSEKTLWPLMEVIAQKCTTDILPPYGRKLVMVFDDPRVVDKKLKLEEQAVYEKSHTLEEIRKEFYQDDPLGDERDDLLPSQINAQTGKPTPPPPAIIQQPPTQQPPAEDTPVDTMTNDASTETVKADLMRWKRYAIRTFGKSAIKFDSDRIPDELYRTIAAKLKNCRNVGEVADVFEQTKPPKMDSVFYLAKVIENAVYKI